MKKLGGEGLPAARLLMVVASLAPLFVLWAIRGTADIPDRFWIPFCLFLAIAPNMVVLARWRAARADHDSRAIIVRSSKDQSEQILVYLFAMLIPLFGVDLGSTRTTVSALAAFAFVVFIFWHMNLYYVNVAFAAFGFRVFTVQVARSLENRDDTTTIVLLSKRQTLKEDTALNALRLSNTVLVDEE